HLRLRVTLCIAHQYSDPAHARVLLRARHARPCGRRGAEKREEGAALHFHSSTSVARTRNVSGMVSPIAWAVVRLTIRSNLVRNCTGSPLTLAPRRIRSTYEAAPR